VNDDGECAGGTVRAALRLRRFLARKLTPARSFVLSFLLVILAGTALLLLPAAASRRPLGLVDALFTSASAVCVTGLTVVDVGRDLSLFGQIVTLLLFQIGGLGIITFSLVLFGLMGRSLSFRGRELLQSTFLHTPRRDFFRILRFVVVGTFAIEGAGTLLLFGRFLAELSPARAFYYAFYHAVSAFNNCGYSLFSNSLMNFRDDWTVNLVVVALIVLGGLGFIVMYELLNRWRRRQKRLSLHAKVVLLTTAVLIAGGALLFYFFEAGNVLRGAGGSGRVLASLFQSVTPRTCGFNTVDIAALTNATILLLMILMFIGASPGSTGGGIKTSSFALLTLMIFNRLRGRDAVTIFSRTVPAEILGRTIAIVLASAVSVLLIVSLLLLAAGGPLAPPQASRHLFVEYLFETLSAFGTVGLSMNVTATLNDVQKLALALLMFMGRVGPLTLAFAWSSTKRGLVYAEEAVMVG
jgi:trk system potassium uptake protein TrkH